uniref:Protein kinase domain-containing protein n=1 Tax=Ananas comosus var. bracteatus TaxID=296719 RepID=A0A6V7NUA7_ANACO|nr:unnamed protein product [Ananas comosus var. bracteatus]
MYGKHLSTEFKSEIEALSKVQHMNLVRFLGWVEHEGERLIVVEYVGNGTLREHLDGTRGNGLDLGQRLNIAIDVAHAITYLHGYADDPIIHRDVKASNVLLTEALQGKVGDLGFARVVGGGGGADARVDAGEGDGGVRGPGVPPHVPAHPEERRVLLRRPPRRARLRAPPHRARPRRQRARHHPMGDTQVFGGRCGDDDGSEAEARARSRRSGGEHDGAGSEVPRIVQESRPSMKECAEVLWTIRRDYDQHSQQQQQQQQQQPLLTPTAASSNDAVSSVKDVSSEKREENTVKSPKQKW